MGFLSPSASICYFQVTGNAPDLLEHPEQQLAAEGFRSIEQNAEELATGWVQLDDYDCSAFSSPESCIFDGLVAFTLRQDRRRIPAALLKREFKRLCAAFLAEKPTLNFVPKPEKEQLRDRARQSLLVRTLPSPSFYDAVWDPERRLVRFCALGQSAVDTFQMLFHQTFPGLRLQLLHPLARAAQLLPDDLRGRLEQANRAQSDGILEQIEANRWLGTDFQLWLLYRTLNSDSRYRVTTAGPLLDKQPFTAYLDNRLVMLGGGQEGVQKIVVAGPQDHYQETKAALNQGKQIEEATLHLEIDDEQAWKLTLKGERFQFGSYRTPMIQPERDPESDPHAELSAAFLTKLDAVNQGEQLFDSLLSSFLEIRLGDQWQQTEAAIAAWLTQD